MALVTVTARKNKWKQGSSDPSFKRYVNSLLNIGKSYWESGILHLEILQNLINPKIEKIRVANQDEFGNLLILEQDGSFPHIFRHIRVSLYQTCLDRCIGRCGI